MVPIGDLLYRNSFGQIVFNCPACGAESNFDSPNSMNRWSCSICTLTIVYTRRIFLEVLANYKMKNCKLNHSNFDKLKDN